MVFVCKMETKNFNTTTFVLIIFFGAVIDLGICSSSLLSRTNFQVPNIFGQDLTAEIDQVLKENNLTYRPIIKEALQWSQVVYYKSGKLIKKWLVKTSNLQKLIEFREI